VLVTFVCACGSLCTAGDAEQKLSSSGLDSLEALGKSVLQESLAGVTTVADWKPQPSAVTLVTTCILLTTEYTQTTIFIAIIAS